MTIDELLLIEFKGDKVTSPELDQLFEDKKKIKEPLHGRRNKEILRKYFERGTA